MQSLHNFIPQQHHSSFWPVALLLWILCC